MRIAGLSKRGVGSALGGVLAWARKRGSRSKEWVVECPHTETATAITLDAAGHVSGCWYWPQRKNCTRSCASASLQL